MYSNAAMLGQISMERQVLQMFLHRIEEMCQLPRQILSSSGSLSRVVTLLNAIDPSNFEIVPNEQDSDSIRFDNATVITPTGTRLVEALSVDIASGGEDNLLVVGEPGVGKTSTANCNINADCFRTLILKMQKYWRSAPENDDYTNGHSFCNLRYLQSSGETVAV